MKVYKCVFCKDEFISDSYKFEAPLGDKELLDVAFQVPTSLIYDQVSCDIPDNSAEDENPGVADTASQVIDVVSSFQLQEVPLSKAELQAYLKTYFKRVLDHLTAQNSPRIEAFKTNSMVLAKKLLGMFDDLQFYFGSSVDTEAACAFAFYENSDLSPKMIFIRDGLKEEKF